MGPKEERTASGPLANSAHRTRQGPRARRPGRGWLDVLTLAGVALVVLWLSRPRLRDFALSENEADAWQLLERFGLAAGDVEAGERELDTIGDLLVVRPELERWVQDGELREDGALLLHRGYFFDLVEQPDGGPTLRAWPRSYGETGWAAFVRTPAGKLVGHANQDASWSGPEGAPGVDDARPAGPGWRPVPLERP